LTARTPQPGKALQGVRILVGRAQHQASSLSSDLRKLGARVIQIPFIEIGKPGSFQPLDRALKSAAVYDWLVLTSVNGVDALWGRLEKLKLTKRNLRHLQIAAIGPATKKAIEKRGLKVNVVPKEYVAESVVEGLRSKVAGSRVLLARTKVARDVIPRELRNLGAQVDVVEAYETVIPESSRLELRTVLQDPQRRPHVITFTSSSTVRNFVTLLGSRRSASHGHALKLDDIQFASIGPVTSATLRELGLPVNIEAREYTMPGLVQAILKSRR
jgi:uroporphyrinogen-III synthase